MQGQLNRIAIRGFKSIRSLDLDLGPLNVLVGPNGAGKSNFINFFRFVHQLRLKELQLSVAKMGGADKVLFFGRKTTDKLTFQLKFSPNGYVAQLVPTAGAELIFEREYCQFFASDVGYFGGTKTYTLAQPGSKESGLPDRPHTASAPGHVVRYLSDWRVYHFHDTSDSARVKGIQKLSDSQILHSDAGNLAAFLYAIKDHPAYSLIVQSIQRVAPFFQDFVLEPERDNPSGIRLRWRHRGAEEQFDATDFSDGTLRFICLTTLLLQPYSPTIILLDEPELGLHPFAIQLLAAMMKSTSQRSQIIVSTQSATLANQMTWDELVVVDREDNASTFRRLGEEQVKPWLDDYKLGEAWEKNVFGGVP